jgi:NAD(P)-dependent dehydrogenase (short-subunit alcohol dehydrogenase family)
MPSLEGKVAIVTGAGRGIGREHALALARAGSSVVVNDLGGSLAGEGTDSTPAQSVVNEIVAAGRQAVASYDDVSNFDAAEHMIERAVERYGRLDILVNNAGVIQVGPITTMTLDDFRYAMAVNFWGALHATWAALPLMRAQGGGHIMNIVSIGGKISAPHLGPYTASKFALAGWSETLHAELAAEGIGVTTVYPGLMRTGSPRHALFKGHHRVEFAWFSIADALPLLSISVRRAARRIVSACQQGVPSLVLPLPARLPAWATAILPATTARILALVNRLLPRGETWGTIQRRGRDSESAWSPSALTALGDRAARTQNQLG